MRRFGAHRSVDTPSGLESVREGAFIQTKLSRPCAYALSFAEILNYYIGSRVLLLMFWSYPSAIAGLVMAVIIDAVQRHSFWALAHVDQESGECTPLFAYLDSASTISPIVRRFFIRAPIVHQRPRCIGARLTCSRSMPMDMRHKFILAYKAGGEVLAGLTTRRKAEHDLFETVA